MRGPEICVRTISRTAIPDKFGNRWQYHSRSDRHSKAVCWGTLFDLLTTSKTLAAHARSGEVGFGVNHEMADFKHARKKNLDLVICEPRTRNGKGPTPRSFASLADDFGLSLHGEERAALAKLPPLVETPVGAVRVAVEAKACMTAHVRALPRLYDELNSSHQTVHGASGIAIAVGTVMINIADSFVSSDRNRNSLAGTPAVVNVHRQPADALRVIDKAREIPRRTSTDEIGFDALSIVVVDFRNDGTEVTLRTSKPAPDPSDIYNYEQMIRRTAQLYDFRFGRT